MKMSFLRYVFCSSVDYSALICKDVAAVSLTGITQNGPKKSNCYLQSLAINLVKPVLTVILGYKCKLFHKAFACQGM